MPRNKIGYRKILLTNTIKKLKMNIVQYKRKDFTFMKRYLNFAFYYFLFAMIGGVFYREFTKFFNFSEKTTLSLVHVHLMVLGTFLFLLLALFTRYLKLEEEHSFRRFLILYSIALPFMVIMMVVKGTLQVLKLSLSSGFNAAISGIAGISHILMLISFLLLFHAFRKCSE